MFSNVSTVGCKYSFVITIVKLSTDSKINTEIVTAIMEYGKRINRCVFKPLMSHNYY